jgi:hypothetical protein
MRIIICAPDGVKLPADSVCLDCNVPATASRAAREEAMTAFEDHQKELEKYEQMFGLERGRLAVSLDRVTNALVLVGQHGVYCHSQRNASAPAMDIQIITQELAHAKELIQSVMELLRQKGGKQKSV